MFLAGRNCPTNIVMRIGLNADGCSLSFPFHIRVTVAIFHSLRNSLFSNNCFNTLRNSSKCMHCHLYNIWWDSICSWSLPSFNLFRYFFQFFQGKVRDTFLYFATLFTIRPLLMERVIIHGNPYFTIKVSFKRNIGFFFQFFCGSRFHYYTDLSTHLKYQYLTVSMWQVFDFRSRKI